MKKLLAATAVALMMSSLPAFADDGKMPPHNMGAGMDMMKERMEHWKEKREELLAKLPAEKADQVRKLKEEFKEERKANREQYKALRDEIKTIMTAEKFDKAAYLAKVAEIQDKHDAAKKSRNEKIASLASTMNVEERKILADLFGPHKGCDGKMCDKKKGMMGEGKGMGMGGDMPPPPPQDDDEDHDEE